jgi:ribosomal protein S18 acetylase RimI-like enzyme
LVEQALSIVESSGYDVLWCDAREVALGFYEQLGFERIDEWYDIPNIGKHQFMYYRFKR